MSVKTEGFINGRFITIIDSDCRKEDEQVKAQPQPLTETSVREKYAYDMYCMVEHFNSLLKVSVFSRIYEGVLLCALANLLKPNFVDEKESLVKEELLDNSADGELRKMENRNIGITALRTLGVYMDSETAEWIKMDTPFEMTGLLVQVLRLATVGRMHFQNFEILVHLFDGWSEPEEAISILATEREQMLIIWLNAQISAAGMKVTAFDDNLADSKADPKGLHNIIINMAFVYRIFVAYPNINAPKMKDKPAAGPKTSAAPTHEQRIQESCKYGASEETLIRWLNSFGHHRVPLYHCELTCAMGEFCSSCFAKGIIGGPKKVAELDDNGLTKWFNESMEKYGQHFSVESLELKSANAIDISLADADDETAAQMKHRRQQQSDANNSGEARGGCSTASSRCRRIRRCSQSSRPVIVYASKLGPETDLSVYRSVLMELNALSLKTN
uniref:Calponin-homology (CH) domain-containing protein n=1 Tax=Macrostomum lignano TaxID=282301 RepID=A0A1I8FH29_9PLAT